VRVLANVAGLGNVAGLVKVLANVAGLGNVAGLKVLANVVGLKALANVAGLVRLPANVVGTTAGLPKATLVLLFAAETLATVPGVAGRLTKRAPGPLLSLEGVASAVPGAVGTLLKIGPVVVFLVVAAVLVDPFNALLRALGLPEAPRFASTTLARLGFTLDRATRVPVVMFEPVVTVLTTAPPMTALPGAAWGSTVRGTFLPLERVVPVAAGVEDALMVAFPVDLAVSAWAVAVWEGRTIW